MRKTDRRSPLKGSKTQKSQFWFYLEVLLKKRRIALSLGQFLILFQRYFRFKKMQMRHLMMSSTPLNPERRNININNVYILLKLWSYANTNGTFQRAQLLLDRFLIWGSLFGLCGVDTVIRHLICKFQKPEYL